MTDQATDTRLTTDHYFSVAVAERADWPQRSGDTLIAKFDPPLLATKERLIRWALATGEQTAIDLGTHLHHADFVLTSNPDVVREWGIMPDHRDCPECIAGLNTALAALEATPDLVVAVGQLHWSPGPRRRWRWTRDR